MATKKKIKDAQIIKKDNADVYPEPVTNTEVAVQEDVKDIAIDKLISQAITNNTPVETMEKLLSMRRELKEEWAKEKYNNAMSKLQKECPIITKDKQVKNKDGRTVRYSYAPLDSILKQTGDIIADNGFSYKIETKQNGDNVTAICQVTHNTGHREYSDFTVPAGRSDFMNAQQSFASALTYAKRYAFCNAFGILTGDDDDDANIATPPKVENKVITPTQPQRPPVTPPQVQGISDPQMRMIFKQIQLLGKTKDWFEAWALKVSGINGIENLTMRWASKFIETLQKKVDELATQSPEELPTIEVPSDEEDSVENESDPYKDFK